LKIFRIDKLLLTAILLLLLMGLLAGGAARNESVAIDEVAHTAAGVSYLQKLDMRMNEEHPPLAKVLAAAPLVLRGVHADYSHLSWTFSLGMFHQYLGEWVFGHWFLMRWNDPHSTLLWARVPMLLVMMVLGLVIYLCGSRLGDQWGGLLCLTAYVTMPAFLTFGPLVITDVVVTLFWLLTTWYLAEMWVSPTRGKVITFGLVFAGALLSKFSSGLMLFVFPAVALSLRLRPVPGGPTEKFQLRLWRRRAWRNILKATLWAGLFVYLVYLVLSWNQPSDSFSLIPHFPSSTLLRRLLMPLGVYLRGLMGFALSAGSRPTYILGHAYPHGVWFYFPVLFLLKSQLGFLVILLLAVAVALGNKFGGQSCSGVSKGRELHWRCLWVSLVVYTAACLLSRLDISIRHFLIPLVLIVLLLAPLPRMLEYLRRRESVVGLTGTWVMTALGFILVVTAILAYPNFMPFLNALSMGRPGYTLVNDSNLDWNQSLPDAETFARQHGLTRLLLDEYGFSEPQAYVPEAQIWNCQEPSPVDSNQWAVVSANNIVDAHNCLWLLKYPRQLLAGGSMYAIQLPATIPVAGTADGPPLPADYHYLGGMHFGDEDAKTIFLTCIHDPQQLQTTMDRFTAIMKAERQKRRKH
jgi:hypothetical protein